MSDHLAWMEDAACRDEDPDLFFPDRGEATGPAKAICFACPVWDHCFEFGLYQKFGIWAGTSERERRQLRRRRGIRLADDLDGPDHHEDHPLEETA